MNFVRRLFGSSGSGMALPDGQDADVFKQLIKSGANLSEPREMIFCLYASREAADAFANEAAQFDWHCGIQESADPNPTPETAWFIEAKKDNYLLTKETFEADKAVMLDLAAKHHADYDGWYASV